MSEEKIPYDDLGSSVANLAIQINAQYVKDLSFENPNAPKSLQLNEEPIVEVNVDVRGSKVTEDLYEVALTTTVIGNSKEVKLFIAELTYAGLFTFPEIDDSQIQEALLIECPRLLFPFSRAIIADVTRDGGFPPLLIQPVDFALLYQKSQDDGTELMDR